MKNGIGWTLIFIGVIFSAGALYCFIEGRFFVAALLLLLVFIVTHIAMNLLVFNKNAFSGLYSVVSSSLYLA